MAVIEEEEIEEKTPPVSSASRTDKMELENKANGDVSDGFETASDRDVSDDENDVSAQNGIKDHHGVDIQQQEQAVQGGESYEDALNDEELKQKALSQANDAKVEGNKLFGDGQYEEALSQYELALQLTSEFPTSEDIRSICYSNRGVCFLKLGKYEETIKECSKALELNPTYNKALVRRGEAHEKLEHFEEAIADLKKVLELDPSNDQARRSIRRLEPLAAEKREKMKEEMLGKLKDLGNTVLGRFGMSVDNFKAVKDPNTGSYSISFQK